MGWGAFLLLVLWGFSAATFAEGVAFSYAAPTENIPVWLQNSAPEAFQVSRGLAESDASQTIWSVNLGLMLMTVSLLSGWLLTALKLCSLRKTLVSGKNIIANINDKLEQQSLTLKTQERLISRLRHQNDDLLKAQTALFEVVSHELKNPLAAIKCNFMSWFRQANIDEVMLERARLVESSIKRLESFCAQASAITGLDTPAQGNGSVSLSTMVSVIGARFSKSIKSAGILIEVDIEHHFEVAGDSDKLTWLVSNLVQSAVGRARHGDLIKLSLTEQEGSLVLSVSETRLQAKNNFYGYQESLNESQIQQGFEVFSASKIAQYHKAIFSCRSDNKNGTVTRVIFPEYQIAVQLAVSQEPEAELPFVYFGNQRQPVLEMAGPSSESPRCLLLDPDSDSQMCLAQSLSKYFNVKGVFESQYALQQAESWQPDVVICELQLGDSDAFSVLKKMRSISELEELPIVIVSTQNNTENRLRALEMEIFTFFNKPYSEDLLCKTALKLSGISKAKQQLENIKQNVPFQQSRDTIFLNQLNSLIEKHMDDEDFHFEDYFDGFSMSKRQFFRRVNALTRCTPKQYLIKKRLELARHLLGKGVLLEKVTCKCGFRNSKSMMKLYEAHFNEKVV